jgi:hypothetical protein
MFCLAIPLGGAHFGWLGLSVAVATLLVVAALGAFLCHLRFNKGDRNTVAHLKQFIEGDYPVGGYSRVGQINEALAGEMTVMQNSNGDARKRTPLQFGYLTVYFGV